jgi:hypothetical protein
MPIVSSDRSDNSKRCAICKSPSTSLEKTAWGLLPHWYKSPIYGFKRPICQNCHVRTKLHTKHVLKDKRSRWEIELPTVSKYALIKPKKKKYRGIIVIFPQYCLWFNSNHTAKALIIRKGLVDRANGLENNRHFWRGVYDGDKGDML